MTNDPKASDSDHGDAVGPPNASDVKQAPKKRRAPVIVLVVLLTLAGGAFGYARWRQSTQSEPTVFHGNVDIHDVTLAFRVPGRVTKVLKNEGDHVRPGEVIAMLDAAPYRLALEQARAAVDVANAQLARVEAGARREDISEARAILSERKAAREQAEDTYERTARLEQSGALSRQALVDARAGAERSRAAVNAAQATLQKLVNGARSEEIVVANAEATRAQTAVAAAELNLADTKLEASTAGVVVTRAVEPGTMVAAGSPALVVSFDDPVWIRAYTPERELAKLAPGTPVEVLSDARPNRPYQGQVGYVSPQAEFTPKNVETEELRTSLVYRFRVIVSQHDDGLRQGMPVTVRLREPPGPKTAVRE